MDSEQTFKPVSSEVLKLIGKVIENVQHKSYAQRHPELGKMMNCQVCGRRHFSSQVCKQRFAVRHIEEDVETGERTVVYATAIPADKKPTRNQVLGAKMFKGRRIKPHVSRTKLMMIEKVRKLLENVEINLDSKEFQDQLKLARKMAEREIRHQDHIKADRLRRQQDLSRRINRGLVIPGTQI